MGIEKVLFKLEFKDWLIIVTLTILVICFIQIRRLKRIIVQEVRRRLIPEIVLELDINERTIFIKNQSAMLAKDIKIEEVKLTLVDYGFAMDFSLKFEDVDFLKANERLPLNFKVFKAGEECMPSEARRIIPHLVSIPFKIKIDYANIENLKFSCLLVKKVGNKKFALIRIESLD
jgi:hypothetical protein